jgi:hypothetical protein
MAVTRRIKLLSDSRSGALEALVNGIRSVVHNVGDVHDKRIRIEQAPALPADPDKFCVAMLVSIETIVGA